MQQNHDMQRTEHAMKTELEKIAPAHHVEMTQ